MPEKKVHVAPWECVYPKENEGVCLPGRPPKSDREYFEIMCLCVLQAGLSWRAIRKNWERLKRAYFGFDYEVLAEKEPKELMERPGAIRYARKNEAIVHNARVFKRIVEEYGSFSAYLAKFKSEKEAVKELAKIFKHLGEYSAEYFLHSVGYV